MTKFITVKFEVTSDIDSDRLHELLCLDIHEGDFDANDRLAGRVLDIQVIGEEVIT